MHWHATSLSMTIHKAVIIATNRVWYNNNYYEFVSETIITGDNYDKDL